MAPVATEVFGKAKNSAHARAKEDAKVAGCEDAIIGSIETS